MTKTGLVLHFPGSEGRDARIAKREEVFANRQKIRARTARISTPNTPEDVDWLEKHIQRLIGSTIKNAHARGIPFNLTRDQLVQLGNAQGWVCAVTGVPFSQAKMKGISKRPFVPSIDRINSADGYFLENARLVCAATNLALNEWGEPVFQVLAVSYVSRLTPKQLRSRLEALAVQKTEGSNDYEN